MKHRTIVAALVVATLSLGCATGRGTRPADMSEREHLAAAATAEEKAAAEEGNGSKSPLPSEDDCLEGEGFPICWTESRRPTEEYSRKVERHRKLAEKHRQAAEALADAEHESCADLADVDRDMSPFSHAGDVLRVEKLLLSVGETPTLRGAKVVLRKVEGLSAERLQNLVDCHLARNAALGHRDPEMPYCPLVPAGVTAAVNPEGPDLVVLVRASDTRTAEEVWARASRLAESSK